MRQRAAKNLKEKYGKYEDLIVRDPMEYKRRWKKKALEAGTAGKVFLEIGCGKGQFIAEIAQRDPEGFYIGV